MLAWLSRLSRLTWSLCKSGREATNAMADLEGLMPSGRASALREKLRLRQQRGQAIPTETLLALAKEYQWDAVELGKLRAYIDFYSGQVAAGYQRVISEGLARNDYEMCMTACVHCYMYDRLGEAYLVIRDLEVEGVDGFDPAEFYAYAGYIAYVGGGSVGEALKYFDRALDNQFYSPLLATNAYPIYFELGCHEKADRLRKLIHERYAHDQEAIYAAACVELARDYYPEGFRLAESRYSMPEVARSMNPSLLPRVRWLGEDIAGKRLLVHGEQGLGDIVMMSRYLPLLTNQGVKVIFDCREAAAPLLEYNFPQCEIVAGDLRSTIEARFDLWIGMMSLPHIFSTTATSVPGVQGYLSVPPDQQVYWSERVAQLGKPGKIKIGVAWSGNPSHRADRRRSIPFEMFDELIQKNPDQSFFALQKSVPDVRPANLYNLSEELVTLADTAALIAEMDLIITVDTSIVHLAGALGKKTWLLLPYRYEWRWGLEGEGNNWYESVRVLRQSSTGGWADLLKKVCLIELSRFVFALESTNEYQ